MVESSLSEGPIYFSYYSTVSKYDLRLRDPDLATSLTLDVKIEGSSQMQGEEKVILMLRFHYNVSKDSEYVRRRSSHFVDETGKTTLNMINVAQNNRVVSRNIYWSRVSVPEKWLLDDNADEWTDGDGAGRESQQEATSEVCG
ncbi:hypothetical protein SASPL_138958 [Salvia splendens]|uniref:Uncharacterized protein n=1 Tax=Salvia splendens TaxID=180675 RepID=A0A8X8ZED5_SALSN|nr:hypothetical protein SASPL_138958 [Salvia splendens]